MTLSFPIYRLKHQAKRLARETKVPLHRALDQIAQREGFRSWAHLSANQSQANSVDALMSVCHPGELVLIAARPEQGKTLLALELLQTAAKAGRCAWFFTLEYVEQDLKPVDLTGIHLDMSDDISADHIAQKMRRAPSGSIAVIDYLQLLDQRRILPPLADQVAALKQFALSQKVTVVALSQVDRRFDGADGRLPSLNDLRLPNPVDLDHISSTCFLNDGRAEIARHAS